MKRFEIVNKLILTRNIKRIDVFAENIARVVQPGQFVNILPFETSKWIPLSVVDTDSRRGIITLIFKEMGPTTKNLGAIAINDCLFSVMGPFGKPASIKNVGVVVCGATGLGIASLLPVARAYKNAGNKVICVMGADKQKNLMLEAQMRLACYKLIVVTKDGSYQRRGEVPQIVNEIIGRESVGLVYTIGAVDMMEAVCEITRKESIQTYIQLNTFIKCGCGMCGSCRIKAGNKIVLSCQEGPEFDGHKVDFDLIKLRLATLKGKESFDDDKSSSDDSAMKAVDKFFPGGLKDQF